jgi:hypothetical protein
MDVSCFRATEIAGWEAFQPDHIASIAGCISNEPTFAIELRDFNNPRPPPGRVKRDKFRQIVTKRTQELTGVADDPSELK